MQDRRYFFIRVLSAFLIALGIFLGGFAISKALFYFKTSSRMLTVKGLAEKDVKSDLGIWEVDFREVGENLLILYGKIQKDQSLVIQFLKQHQFQDSEISIQPIKVEDRFANVYDSSNKPITQRYVVTSGIRIRSIHVDAIQKTNQEAGLLIQEGVALMFDTYTINPNPSYYFTNLDTLRPTMLSEATNSARLIANQFAKDTHSHLGGIMQANQGVFQIMNRDTSTMSADWNSNQSALGSIDKKIRLVTTISYLLKK